MYDLYTILWICFRHILYLMRYETNLQIYSNKNVPHYKLETRKNTKQTEHINWSYASQLNFDVNISKIPSLWFFFFFFLFILKTEFVNFPWQKKKNESFVLSFFHEKERNVLSAYHLNTLAVITEKRENTNNLIINDRNHFLQALSFLLIFNFFFFSIIISDFQAVHLR